MVAPVGRVGDRARVAAFHSIALQAPQEQANVGSVVFAADIIYVPHLGGVGYALEGAVEQIETVRVAQVHRGALAQPQVIEVLRGHQKLEELDGFRRPAGDVAGHLLQHRHSALAASVAQRVGDKPSLAERPVLEWQQITHTQQVANVRYDPLIAGLNEPVVVEPVHVALQQLQLTLDHAEQSTQWPTLRHVARAVHRW
jgi:hypothetical protein